MSINEIVDFALKNNPEVKALRLEEERINGQLEKAKLLFPSNPIIEGSFTKKEATPDSTSQFNDYGFRLSQEIEISGQRSYRIQSAYKDLEKIRFEINDKERILISEIKESFTKSLYLKEKKELLKQVLKLKEELLDYTLIRFKSGDISALEVNIAEVEVSKVKRDLILSIKEFNESIYALQRLAGLTPDGNLTIEGDLDVEDIKIPNKEDLKKIAIENRPDLRATLAEIEKAKLNYHLINKQIIPNLTISASYERDEKRNVYGLSFSIPIPIFDRKQMEKKDALVNEEQAKIKHLSVVNTVEKEINEALSNLISALDELSLFKKEILVKTKENLDLLNLAFKEGKISFYDVRTAQKDAIELRLSYLDTVLMAKKALIDIEKVTGGIK
jgi:cobalt-zinc-cadmium efflux system outer membrane protein